MPNNAIPAENFLNRAGEIAALKCLADFKGKALGGNVFLEGVRGIGKTELLWQLHRILFAEGQVVPFYYSFKTANLKGAYFARDYFGGFLRQYIAFRKQDPGLSGSAAEPLGRLLPMLSSLGAAWLIGLAETFEEHVRRNDAYGQIVAAISAPALAAEKGGSPVCVMLDDFDAAQHLYESVRGDAYGLVSLFRESLRSRGCPHIVTGPAAAVEAVFSDPSLAGTAERMQLGPLPEDLAAALFRSHLENLKIACAPSTSLEFLRILGGNPLYVRNLAKAAWKMQKKELREKDLVESYAFDVSDGETAFFWSSACNRLAGSKVRRRAMIRLLLHILDHDEGFDGGKLARIFGWNDTDTREILQALDASELLSRSDRVFRDVLHGLFLREIEGRTASEAEAAIEAMHLSPKGATCFEMIVPMSENAELVVAKAVEQIGKNLRLDADFLNHLQLALIEVCINAIEHSGSYDRKIFLKCLAGADRLEIFVENSGRHFSLDGRRDIPPEEKLRMGMKRGWGFKLVYAIMDDVRVERAGDRTRVILTKHIDHVRDKGALA